MTTPTGRATAVRTPPNRASPTSPTHSSPTMDQVREFMDNVAWLLHAIHIKRFDSYMICFKVWSWKWMGLYIYIYQYITCAPDLIQSQFLRCCSRTGWLRKLARSLCWTNWLRWTQSFRLWARPQQIRFLQRNQRIPSWPFSLRKLPRLRRKLPSRQFQHQARRRNMTPRQKMMDQSMSILQPQMATQFLISNGWLMAVKNTVILCVSWIFTYSPKWNEKINILSQLSEPIYHNLSQL